MTVRDPAPPGEPPPFTVLTWRWIAAGVAFTVVTTAAALITLLAIARGDPKLEMDAVKTGLTVAAGSGGAFGLLLAVRRQWLKERAQAYSEHQARLTRAHEDRLADQAELDATERRITDLYARAIDQLGHDRPAVRLGGMYALERLAQGNPSHRQTTVDVICAYLRAPLDDPAERVGYDELEVRRAGLRVLQHHLRLPPDQPERVAEYWDGVLVNLRGATLPEPNFHHCRFSRVDLRDTVMLGAARFDDAKFTREARFDGATFSGPAMFQRASFAGDAMFVGAAFTATAVFEAADFAAPARFTSTEFTNEARFDGVRFRGDARFDMAVFHRDAAFTGAGFNGHTGFQRVRAEQRVDFRDARFGGRVSFGAAVFARSAIFVHVICAQDAVFGGTRFGDTAPFDAAEFHGSAAFGGAAFGGEARFVRAVFHGPARFSGITVARSIAFTGARFEDSARIGRSVPAARIGCDGARVLGDATLPPGIELVPDGNGPGRRLVRAA